MKVSNFYDESANHPCLRYFIINTKNYAEASGREILRLVEMIQRISAKRKFRNRVSIGIAAPAFCISQIHFSFPSLSVYAQHLDDSEVGSSTGYLVPEIAKSFGAVGSLLNHSEHRLPPEVVATLVTRLTKIGLESLVCAKDHNEIGILGKLGANYIAVEPPDLIGSGKAVSTSMPELLVKSKEALEKITSSKRPIFLCGAGIVSSEDVVKAVDLGAQGILVASGVVKAANWSDAIESLALGLI